MKRECTERGLAGGSVVKNLYLPMQETQARSPDGKIPHTSEQLSPRVPELLMPLHPRGHAAH